MFFGRKKGACGTTMGVKELVFFKRRVFSTDLGSIWDRFWTDLGGPGDRDPATGRNARALARLFEFEEFEEDFEIDPDTLRPFGWRRI